MTRCQPPAKHHLHSALKWRQIQHFVQNLIRMCSTLRESRIIIILYSCVFLGLGKYPLCRGSGENVKISTLKKSRFLLHFWRFQTILFFRFPCFWFFSKKKMKSSISKISTRQRYSRDSGKNYSRISRDMVNSTLLVVGYHAIWLVGYHAKTILGSTLHI